MFCRMAASPPYPAYREHFVGPVSVAPPGITPDSGVTALSGLQEAHCRPGKHSSTGHYAGWRRNCLIRPTGSTL
ncbi:hypothetical protein HMPREF3207_00307 [Citrobacter koseri]|nr:hypothetical protein HMPREF3207_00307 [Citrobacter koseri]